MTDTQRRTETNDTQATIDDVEGHRVAQFVEDYKDDDDDVAGHRIHP